MIAAPVGKYCISLENVLNLMRGDDIIKMYNCDSMGFPNKINTQAEIWREDNGKYGTNPKKKGI